MTPAALRVPWPEGFPDVVVQQGRNSPVRLKNQPGYEAAKRGADIIAAREVVRALLDPAAIEGLAELLGDATPILVAVHAEEHGLNALPLAYAFELGRRLGLSIDTEIVQTNRTFRTGSDGVHRLVARGYFSGTVRMGQTYVIVDDVVAQGGTLADLRSYIERLGGRVVATTALIGSAESQRLALRPATLSALRERFGAAEPEYEGAFGHGYEGLTDSEARAILRLGMVDAFRDRVIAPAQARLGAATWRAGGEGGAGGRESDEGVSQGLTPHGIIQGFHPSPTIRDGAHHYNVRVYFEDTDAAGVVYYANYLKLAERARTEALRDLGVPHAALTAEFGLIFVVRRAKLDYLGPARLDDSLVVVTRPLVVGAASVELRQTVHRVAETDRSLVVADIQLACVRQNDLRPARLPPRWRVALTEFSMPGAGGVA